MKTGSKITGYWTFWPFHGEEFARRFETLEDAKAYLPVKKSNKDRKLPLGERWITRVAWGKKPNGMTFWTYDKVEKLTQDEVDELFMKMAAEVTT